jgi:hypothetical protein
VHAFVADEPHLQAGAAVARRQQGDEVIGGEVGVADRIAGLADHVGERELDLLAARKQTLAVLARQRRDQTVRGGTTPHGRHRTLLDAGGNA